MDGAIDDLDFVGGVGEDADLNRINEWLSTQGSFNTDTMNT
jgi:hypothetical protein